MIMMVFYSTYSRPFPVGTPPRIVTIIVNDLLATQSNPATITILFTNIDNPPILDLNGPMDPGTNHSTVYRENSEPVFVS